MSATLRFLATPDDLKPHQQRTLLGRRDALASDRARALLPEGISVQAWEAMVGSHTTDDGRSASHYTGSTPSRVSVAVLPDACSRHNAPSRAWAIPKLLANASRQRHTAVIGLIQEPDHAWATALAIARSFPTVRFTKAAAPEVQVCLLADAPLPSPERLQLAAEGVQAAAAWCDQPPSHLGTQELIDEARALLEGEADVAIHTIIGEALRDEGLGGLYAVGKAAAQPPALLVLDYTPSGATEHQAWVGKGIVYDTGGLSLKSRTAMPGMKTDMGGAAAVLAAFVTAVKLRAPTKITAVLCLAENAIGPNALRNDDVITMLSGRTVEVNNTDAEGRLVLADGLAWVCEHREPDLLLDLATLTGAQGVATGQHHAALVTPDADLEARLLDLGRSTGDLLHPLPFAPELHRRELASNIADLRNSVKNRNNAQSSCAALFLHANLPKDAPPWAHIDMAAPATQSGKGTGYGVGLLLAVAGALDAG